MEELVRIAELRKQEIRERLRNRQRLESDLPVEELSPAEREVAAPVAKEVWTAAMRVLNVAVEAQIPQDGGDISRVELRRSNAIDHKLYPEQVDLVATVFSFSTLQPPASIKPTLVRYEEEFAFYPDRVIKTTREGLWNFSKGVTGLPSADVTPKAPIKNEAGREDLGDLLSKIQKPVELPK